MVFILTLAGAAGVLVAIAAMLRASWRALVDALLSADTPVTQGPPAEIHVLRPAAPAVRSPRDLRIAA